MPITQVEAVAICREMHDALAPYGYYPALTGGCLYRDGERKDLDVVIYRDRRHKPVNMHEVMYYLNFIGIHETAFHGFVTKARKGDIIIDLLNPEDDGKYGENK